MLELIGLLAVEEEWQNILSPTQADHPRLLEAAQSERGYTGREPLLRCVRTDPFPSLARSASASGPAGSRLRSSLRSDSPAPAAGPSSSWSWGRGARPQPQLHGLHCKARREPGIPSPWRQETLPVL